MPIDAQVSDQIVAETQGNPLALLELPRTLSAAEFANFVDIIENSDWAEEERAQESQPISFGRLKMIFPNDLRLLLAPHCSLQPSHRADRSLCALTPTCLIAAARGASRFSAGGHSAMVLPAPRLLRNGVPASGPPR